MDTNFKNILERELEERISSNSSYSLRAFARDLQIDPSNLSKILSGKTNPFTKTKERILLDLGYSPLEVRDLLQDRTTSLKDFRAQDIESFEYISEWHHDAILELTRLSFFKADYTWIGSTLGIGTMKVKLAVERLLRLGYLEIDKNGNWVDKLGDVSNHLNVNYTNNALKRRQVSVLEQSLQAVKSIPVEDRDHTYTMLAIDKNDIQEVKQEIKKFRRKITGFLERKNVQPNSVYQIHIGFFPLTSDNGDIYEK